MDIQNYFMEDTDMWQICLKEYDSTGFLVGLVSCKTEKVKYRWRRIDAFLSACPNNMVREAQFRRGGRHFPSIVSDGKTRKLSSPIVAMMPLFEYAKRISK